MHSYCVVPSNIPFVIQRDVLVCEQSDRRHDSLQTYITAVGRCFLWRIRTPNALVRRHSNSDYIPNSCVTCFWLHAQVYWRFVVYLNITERSNFKTSGCLVGRPTCAPATTRLTPQLVGTSAITYNPSPYNCKRSEVIARTTSCNKCSRYLWIQHNLHMSLLVNTFLFPLSVANYSLQHPHFHVISNRCWQLPVRTERMNYCPKQKIPLVKRDLCSDCNQDHNTKGTRREKPTAGVIVYYHPKMGPSRCRETSSRLPLIQRCWELH